MILKQILNIFMKNIQLIQIIDIIKMLMNLNYINKLVGGVVVHEEDRSKR